ncbi:MAG: glycosyltransferase family 1 protein [Bacteroidota bacterium]
MNVAVNARFLLKGRLEGIGWFTHETIKRLVEWHPEHQFIFFFDRPFDQQFVFAKNVKPVVLFPPARHPFLFYAWFEFAVSKALKKYRADVFISTDGFLTLSTDVPTLLVIHDLAHVHFPNQVKYLEQRYYNYFVPKFAAKASRIATVSEYSKQDIHQQYQIQLDKIDVVYNGVRAAFQPIDAPRKNKIKAKYSEGKDYFFYIGAVHPRKNIHRLITAFDQFKAATKAPVKLLIAGRFAWQTGVVKEAYDQARHQNDIEFLNYVNDTEVPLLMGSALGFVYVSLFEGFGVPLLEAMNCEVPIITSDVSSMPEVVGQAAILVNPKSIADIQEALTTMLGDSQKRMALIKFGKEQQKQFSWNTTAKKLESSLLKMIKKG